MVSDFGETCADISIAISVSEPDEADLFSSVVSKMH